MITRERSILARIALVALVGLLAARVSAPYRGARGEARRVRAELIREGFRVELGEFVRPLDALAVARGVVLTNLGAAFARMGSDLRVRPMELVGAGVARSGWRGALEAGGEAVSMAPLHASLVEREPALERLAALLAEGDVAFPQSTNIYSLETVHLSHLKSCARVLSDAALCRLLLGDREGAGPYVAWLTKLAMRPVGEPAASAHRYAYQIREVAFQTTWEMLRTNGWTDTTLGAWQQAWRGVDSLSALPETVAFARAEALTVCRQARLEPSSAAARFVDEVFSAVAAYWDQPSVIWSRAVREWRSWARDARYRSQTSYLEEALIGTTYRDWEVDMRTAVTLPTWQAMRGRLAAAVPSLGAPPDFRAAGVAERSRTSIGGVESTLPEDSLLGHAMEAEARRRVLLAALAVERHRLRHGTLPESLAVVDPDVRLEPPVDPMDGQSLRYRREGTSGYVLYSVGLDGVDGGEAPGVRTSVPGQSARAGDILWPREATESELRSWDAGRRPSRGVRMIPVPARSGSAGLTLSPELMRKYGLIAPPQPVQSEGGLSSNAVAGSMRDPEQPRLGGQSLGMDRR